MTTPGWGRHVRAFTRRLTLGHQRSDALALDWLGWSRTSRAATPVSRVALHAMHSATTPQGPIGTCAAPPVNGDFAQDERGCWRAVCSWVRPHASGHGSRGAISHGARYRSRCPPRPEAIALGRVLARLWTAGDEYGARRPVQDLSRHAAEQEPLQAGAPSGPHRDEVRVNSDRGSEDLLAGGAHAHL